MPARPRPPSGPRAAANQPSARKLSTPAKAARCRRGTPRPSLPRAAAASGVLEKLRAGAHWLPPAIPQALATNTASLSFRPTGVNLRGGHRQYRHPRKPGLVTALGKANADLHPKTVAPILSQAQLGRP